jgi:glycosyltransferase involved in cell wall biosynthesis
VSTPPLVTVGIPFFDEERHLAAAIRSVLAQTWSRLEILLVDDGSTDASLEIAQSFRDDRIQVVSDGHRRFLPTRLNEIVRRARGELVARMDADDVAHPDRLRRQIEALEATGRDCVACGTWVGLVDANETPLSVVEAAARSSPRVALERGLMPHASLLARRSWLEMYPYDEELTRAEDRDLWSRTAGARFTVVQEPLYVVRVSPRNPTFLTDYLESQRQNRILFRRYGPRVLGRLRTSRRWAESIAKGVVMTAAVGLGAADRLVRRRGRTPTEPERRLILDALELSHGR